MSKILVAYFSAGGVTARAAEEIAAAVGGDLYEIAPAEPYTAADLDWRDKGSRTTREMTDPASRPALGRPAAGSERVWTPCSWASPIWWGVEPRAVDTFLDGGNFHRKEDDPLRHLRRQRHRPRGGASAPAVPRPGLVRRPSGEPWRGGLGQVRGKGVSLPCRGVREN